MREVHNSFVGRTFLRSVWAYDYETFKSSEDEEALEKRLVQWAARADLKETSAEGPFVEEFFRRTWGYVHTGQEGSDVSHTLHPKFPVPGAGAKGGSGEADLAIGYFTKGGIDPVPQVLCEFKDIKSALDAPQKSRKGGLSPVKQCLNYLSNARRGMFGNEPVLPQWGIVTDMNEFRLYWHDRAPQQFLRFHVRQPDLYSPGLLKIDGTLNEDEEARFDRFLFWKIFHRDTLLTTGGKPLLAQLIAKQWVRERELEKAFYAEYRAYRERLIGTLIEHNPLFPGTKGRLVRLAQKILDRCIFVFFCEDMGAALKFPAQLLRDFLIDRSRDAYFDPKGVAIWEDVKRLFKAMNTGTVFGPHKINQFNGGLFADDPELEALIVPNEVFCQHGQGQNEASLYASKETLLYFSASYNYAGGWAQGLTRPPVGDGAKDKADAIKADPLHSLGLYTLGRIFEQSITELEILEAEAEGRPSLNKEGKRKRDGVYYTPEWVVERIVAETIGPRLADLKRGAGWPNKGLPTEAQIDAYRSGVEALKIVDPACGSGAFLITALRFLLDEMKTLQAVRQQVTGKPPTRDEDALVRDILRQNIYGVDINPASTEITRLALWLHTARGDKPLSSLDATIKEGNSLINDDFYKGQIDLAFYDADEKERVNTFDWEKAFPEVFEAGGFDAVVGNPPYVKLQNFRKVHSDMAEFIRNGRPGVSMPGYASAKTGNFDLYLPFIEKGLSLLNENGRLGFIAPSLWVMNEYGEGLRELVGKGRNLDRWLDFKSFQIFEEATTYTALQFFTKKANDVVRVAYAPGGSIPDAPWADIQTGLSYDRLAFGERWLLVTGAERTLVDKLQKACLRLDDPSLANNIFQGLITSADVIYHLKRKGPNTYVHTPRGKNPPPPFEVAIEDALMKPLVSGADAKRYQKPATNTYILFPYSVEGGRAALIPPGTLQANYPNAWGYLKRFEADLRKREAALNPDGSLKLGQDGKPESAPFDDDAWYRFGRHQGLDRQEIVKLIVPRLVPNLRCIVDEEGAFFLDNVDVGGVAIADGIDPFFIAGILNGPVANFVFRRISKPFRGNTLSANKQFIAPLPIPHPKEGDRQEVAQRARHLQQVHTNHRDVIVALARRAKAAPSRNRPETFLFPTLVPARDRIADAPAALEEAEKREWAKQEHKLELEGFYSAIGQRLRPEAELDAQFSEGELRFLVDGIPVIEKVFVSKEEGPFILAQWKAVASTFSVTEKTTGKHLCDRLRKLVVTENKALIDQFIALQEELGKLEADIAAQEAEMNALTYRLYGLTKAEIALVERR
ncbi:MAG: Eco57I restriction-modification methylase domain-containing protein [Rhizobiaceae bacterium]|nr:Eco57I restriction-modification methylase domain-containing protein [Rhizobiaceae bacterium]MCV0409069.1 Eco57I restriction-modification methylase domain-containing protein [Rhizobiaceae bacterium]